ncbi:hypothetical protein J6590_012169 [Homalodisca vitripennis]|nr:hypothetical protein J6590_012169 [Homalodisca vitripennis]
MYRTRKISSDELAAICHVAQSRNVAQGHHDRLRYYMHYENYDQGPRDCGKIKLPPVLQGCPETVLLSECGRRTN